MKGISDNELMQKVKSGDIDKLGLLFERHKKMLFGYFYKLTGSQSTSEDLVQNVFYKILKYRTKFRHDGKFLPWMLAIAHNASMDHFQKNKKYALDESYEWKTIDGANIDEQITKEEKLRQLKTAMSKLSPDKREILILSKIHGLRYKEIGEMLKCTENNVKTKVFRALRDLKELYTAIEN